MTSYALRTIDRAAFQLAKFSDDFNVEAVYTLVRKGHGYVCDCPAGLKSKLKPCKHQRMMPILMGACNLPRFYNPDTGAWAGLFDLAPGMKAEHEEGEVALTSQQAAEFNTEQRLKGSVLSTRDLEPTNAGEGPVPSPLAATPIASPSVSDRGQPTPIITRRL